MAGTHSTKKLHLVGKTFHRLFVIAEAPTTKYGHSQWLCRCRCGTEKVFLGNNIVRGYSKSCGCLKLEIAGVVALTHGQSKSLAYKRWAGMRKRCRDKNCSGYYKYGGRGITVCKEWESFPQFLADMGPPPSALYSIERNDNNLGYSKDNCCWATNDIQSRNKRSTLFITLSGITLCATDWAEKLGIKQDTMFMRIRRGHPLKKFLRPFTNKPFYG